MTFRHLSFAVFLVALGLTATMSNGQAGVPIHLPNQFAVKPRVRGDVATAKLPNSLRTVSYDADMLKAATIAKSRASSHSRSRCWRSVKQALVAAEVVPDYPKTAYAKQAAHELPISYGFRKVPVNNPFDAPLGAVLVYGGRGAGHVEIRTEAGFVSDFSSSTPSHRPLIGVFVKPSDAI